jgi:hypothetical protein
MDTLSSVACDCEWRKKAVASMNIYTFEERERETNDPWNRLSRPRWLGDYSHPRLPDGKKYIDPSVLMIFYYCSQASVQPPMAS